MKQKFDSNLKLYREKNNLSQYQISRILGISRGTYSNYELGIRKIPNDMEKKICTFLKIQPKDLYLSDIPTTPSNNVSKTEEHTETIISTDSTTVQIVLEISGTTSIPPEVAVVPAVPEIPVPRIVQRKRPSFLKRIINLLRF